MATLPHSSKDFGALQHTAYQLAQCTEQLFQQIEQQQTLATIIDNIRSSLDIKTIFNTTAIEIRKLLNADRVSVFQFEPGSDLNEGAFVSEDVAVGITSALHAKVHDHCFGPQFSPYYLKGRIQAVEDIYQDGLSDCHIQILEQFHVRANLVIPVIKNADLWGLLCIHQCHAPRRWQLAEIEFVRKIADYFAIALQQVEQLEQIKNQTELLAAAKAREQALIRQTVIAKITNRIRQSLDLAVICQTAVEEVRQLIQADRVTIYGFNSDWSGDFLFESFGEGWCPLVGVLHNIKDTHLMETQGGRYAENQTFAVEDIYTVGHSECHITLLEDFQAKAYAIAPIFQGEKLWGLLTAFQNSGPRHWEADEVQLLAQIGEQLGIALQQSDFVKQIQVQSVQLEQTLKDLKQSQAELIQREKMAALGHLVAGVAHEINNPLGAIQGASTNIQESFEAALNELPHLHQRLTPEEQEVFLQLVQRGIHETDLVSSLEGLTTKKKLVAQLQQLNIANPRYVSGLLIDMGVKSDLGFLHPLLQSAQADWAIKLAYRLSRGFVNNQTIAKAVERSSKIVFALKSYARVEQQEVKTLINVVEGLETTLQIYRNQLKQGIDVIRSYDDIPMIWGYPDELIQVWTNLIHNAIQAMEGGGTLKIHVAEHEGGVQVEIGDSGSGIPADVLPQIFDAFYTTKPAGKGSGLGLNICQKIVHKHNGRITCQSQPGNTQFFTWLPIDKNQLTSDLE